LCCFVQIANAQTEIIKEYYPSGKIKTEMSFVDGKANRIKK
jgi:antitoxin component YwqK of YwqJK toxin-antitoxin module